MAQDEHIEALDTAKISASDSSKSNNKFRFITTIAPFVDYGKVITLPMNRETKFEIGIQVELFNRIFVVTEFGNGELVPPDSYTNANYSLTGNYYRLGLGYKIDMNAKNNFGISNGRRGTLPRSYLNL